MLFAEAPTISGEAQFIVALNKENISLSCGISFDPWEDTELIWFHEENKIDFKNPRFKVLGKDLHINDVESSDAGDYRCVLRWAGKEIAYFKDIKVSLAGCLVLLLCIIFIFASYQLFHRNFQHNEHLNIITSFFKLKLK